MPNQITMPAGNTQTTNSPANNAPLETTQASRILRHLSTAPAEKDKAIFVPSYWERKDGYFKDGIFHQPFYAVYQNGEVLEPLGVVSAYPYDKAFHILIHLQAVSKDDFELKPVSWKPLNDFNVILEGKA